jgi:hypothetical protein
MSLFLVNGEQYLSSPFEEGQRDMDTSIGEVFEEGLKFVYDYDMGTTTRLSLEVLLERETESAGHMIRSLAMNAAPFIPCSFCEEEAERVCTSCIGERTGWLCDACAEKHDCEEEMMLPVVNSPRVGLCAYEGPPPPGAPGFRPKQRHEEGNDQVGYRTGS